jgi:signal transduction histidine kinase
VDTTANVLRCVEVWQRDAVGDAQFEAEGRKSAFMRGVGLPGRVWSSREPVYVPDLVDDADFLRAPIAGSEVLHAAFGFPILLGDEVLGVMEFFGHDIRPPDQPLLDMMLTIGSQVGQFIERKRAESALHQAQMELAHVTRVTTMGELTASIAHEVNQPLAAIANNANAALGLLGGDSADLSEIREALGDIVGDAGRAGSIIERVRAQAKRAPPERVPLRLADVVGDVAVLAAEEAIARGVTIRTGIPADLPVVLGDRVQLQQVLLNLVMNAMDAMSSVDATERKLVIRGRSEMCAGTRVVTIQVQDRGRGIDASQIDRLFQAFFTTKPHGMGMGLAISRSIIRAHGGRLWAEPNEGPGATFSFSLPAMTASSD